jgi:hypothetical protein
MPRKHVAKVVPQEPIRKLNKSEWIRRQPTSMSVKAVVTKATEEGIEITPQQVYTVRSRMRDDSKPLPVKKVVVKAVRRKTGGAPRRTSRRCTDSDEMAFRRLVLSIGLPKAEAYLSDLKESVGL